MIRTVLTAAALAATLVAPCFAASFPTLSGAKPIVIAHRGASGYLPEHTLAGYELGIKLGAAYIEPDLLLTRDGHLVAIHDTTLTRTTNVEALFAPRNGDYRVEDFDLAEIKQLTVEPFGPQASTSYPGFTPSSPDAFKVPTFDEVLDFLTAYNAANGTDVGVYPEAKKPTSTGMNTQIVQKLKAAGFDDAADKAYIQSFDFSALEEFSLIQDAEGTSVLQVALGAPTMLNGEFALRENNVATLALSDIATFADGVGISVGNSGATAEFIAAAHALGLQVHGYTLRPLTQAASDDLVALYGAHGYDGFFTDYTDRTLASVNALAPVPLPASALLLLAGLGALALRARRA